MRFAHPQYLWLLAMLPVAYWALRAEVRGREKRFEEFARRQVWERIAPEADFGRRLRKLRVWTLAAAMVVVALSRPQWGVHEEVFKVAGLDIVLALDVSNSMLVEDVVPSRLKKARHAVRSILDALKGDRVGIVAFAGSAYVACPLTTDLGYVSETLETLGPDMVANQGTDIGISLETAARALERGAEDPSREISEDTAPSKVVVLISDGEDLEEKALSGLEAIRHAGAKLYILGVGTEEGAPIPLRDESGGLRGYKNGPDGKPVVSRFHPDDLMKIAAEAGGRYWSLSPGEEEVDELLREIGALERTDYAERKIVFHEDRYQIPLALGVLLLLIELSMSARRLRRRDAALLLAVLLLAGLPRGAAAAPSLGTYLDNRKGLQAYESKKIDEAKKWFGDAQARDPTSPELMYNQGVIQAEEKDLQDAVHGFAGAAKGALERKDPLLGARSFYNLGSALEKNGDAAGAVQSFVRSIDQARAAGDESLENDARKRLERLVQQQQQQQQQRNQQQQQQNEQQSGQGKPEEQKEKEGSDKEQPQRYQETPKDKRDNPFQSKKLTKEDADRVMAELMNRDRQLQMKLKKQKGEGAGGKKEW